VAAPGAGGPGGAGGIGGHGGAVGDAMGGTGGAAGGGGIGDSDVTAGPGLPGPNGGKPKAGANGGIGVTGSHGSPGTASAPEIFSSGGTITQETASLTVSAPTPSAVVAGAPFAVTVSVRDGQGQVITSFSGSVTLSLTTNPDGATLGGTLTAMAQNGVATFSGLTINKAGTYALVAASGGISSTPATIVVQTGKQSPPLVTMTKVRTVLNSKHQVTEVLVTFSGPVNAAEADRTPTYRLATPGTHGSYSAKNAGIIHLAKAVYNASTYSVALTPIAPFALSMPVQLVVYGTGAAGLRDTHGRLIDGDHNGTPGGNAVAILSSKGVTIDAIVLIQNRRMRAMAAPVGRISRKRVLTPLGVGGVLSTTALTPSK
jgi:hypothetical protein